MHRFVFVAIFAALGCTSSYTGTDSGSDSPATGDCTFVDTLEDGCAGDENCVIGVHQTDCCGSSYAYGFNHSERDRFDALEPLCRATYRAVSARPGPPGPIAARRRPVPQSRSPASRRARSACA